MSEPTNRSPIAASPISALLFAQAFSTETQPALTAWKQYLDTLARPYEIFLIEESCPEIPPTADENPDAVKPSRVFAYDRSLGFRDALNEAIRSAQYPLLVFCPADRQFLPNELERWLKIPVVCPKCASVQCLTTRPLKGATVQCPTCSEAFVPKLTDDANSRCVLIDETDLIVGYRAGRRPPWWCRAFDFVVSVLSRVLIGMAPEPRTCWLGSEGRGRRWVARWIFGVRVADPECPFRVARREVFQRLPIQSGGSFVHVEILAKANHLSCLLAEQPVAWTPPAQASNDAIPFGQDARLVFRSPDFGPTKPAAPDAAPKQAESLASASGTDPA
jgi:hypothetical protein